MKRRVMLAASVLSAFVSCVGEDYGECGTWLEFIFDHNMEYTDTFASQVGSIDVHFFDGSGRHVLSRHAGGGTLDGGNRMWLGRDLPSGDYRVVTVGAISPDYSFAGATLHRATLSLEGGPLPARRLPDVWLGPATEIRHSADLGVWQVSLVRETNRFEITLTWFGQGDNLAAITPSIVAPEAGVYDSENRPATTSRTEYPPYYLAAETPSRRRAAISTMRLIENLPGGYSLEVRTGENAAPIWSHDLLPLLEVTKPATRPDGSPLPFQEYLDRRSEWNIDILLGGGPGGNLVVTQITVDGWIVWTHGMDI